MNEQLLQRLVEAFEQMVRAMVAVTPASTDFTGPKAGTTGPKAAPETPANAEAGTLWTIEELKVLAVPFQDAKKVHLIKKILVDQSKVKLSDLTTYADQQKFLEAVKAVINELPTAQQQTALNLINR
jgi:hypothetical protein